jgi:RNA polymerase sigma-70 factor (ECF subfamily)
MAEGPAGASPRPDPEPGVSQTTRPSLLIRIRDANDREAWRQFVDIYAPLIYGLARKRGLQDADAADVTQDVFRAVAAVISSWDYDPKRGSFRGWLHTVTRNKINDFLARKQARGTGDTATQEFLEQQPDWATPDEDETSWQREAQQRIFAWAAERIRGEFQDSTWKAFWQVAVEGKSGEETARELHLSVGAVYVAKSRVLARLKKEIEHLQQE